MEFIDMMKMLSRNGIVCKTSITNWVIDEEHDVVQMDNVLGEHVNTIDNIDSLLRSYQTETNNAIAYIVTDEIELDQISDPRIDLNCMNSLINALDDIKVLRVAYDEALIVKQNNETK